MPAAGVTARAGGGAGGADVVGSAEVGGSAVVVEAKVVVTGGGATMGRSGGGGRTATTPTTEPAKTAPVAPARSHVGTALLRAMRPTILGRAQASIARTVLMASASAGSLSSR